jgi:malate dehydrogenase
MRDVAIIGAGELGGSLAHVLARRDVVGSIRLVDSAAASASGKALDIMQASPIEQFAARVDGAGDVSYAAGAAIVIIADRPGHGEWHGDDALLLLKQVQQFAGQSLVLCAGASQRDLVERGVRELGFPRQRLIGSAPEALAAGLQALLALETNGSPRDVASTVLGVPPHRTVVPWQTVTIGGFSAADVLDEPARRRIEARLGPLWPPGAHALAWAAAEVVAALRGISRRTLSCFVAPDDSAGRRERAGALPVRLGPAGVAGIELHALDPRTRTALESAVRV